MNIQFPYLNHDTREEIFDEARLCELERTYAQAFKKATGLGERSRGAHLRALEAVRGAKPILIPFSARVLAADAISWVARKVRGGG